MKPLLVALLAAALLVPATAAGQSETYACVAIPDGMSAKKAAQKGRLRVVDRGVCAVIAAPGPLTTYSVKAGDTLSLIAARFDVGTDDLVCFNGIRNKDILLVGQRLAIPPEDYTCEGGLASLPTAAPAPTPSPATMTATPRPSGTGTSTGRGSRSTLPFALDAGDYAVEVTLGSACGGDVDTWFALLRSTDGDAIAMVEQSDFLYGTAPGRYFWDVTTLEGACEWRVSLVPLDG